MTEFAEKCRSMMANGEIPPRNWQDRVSRIERTRIYDAYVEYYIGLIKEGHELPKRGWCARGLSEEQKNRIYSARGFGSTDKMRCSIKEAKKISKEIKERKLWLESHGGQHTQDVIEEAKSARERRRNYLWSRSRDKMLRRAISKGWNGLTRQYLDLCGEKEQEGIRNSWSNLRRSIVREAVVSNKRYKLIWNIRSRWPDFARAFTRAGVSSLDYYFFTRCPDDRFERCHRVIWKEMKKHDMSICLEFLSLWEDEIRRNDFCEEIKRGSSKTSDAHAQLRALGFVA